MGNRDKEEIIKLQEMKDAPCPLLQTAFVIRMGEESYFRCIKKGRICCGNLYRAKRFKSHPAAKRYAKKRLVFYGLEATICRTAWYLVSYEPKEEIYYWDGSGYTKRQDAALCFLGIHEAERYQKEAHLEETCFMEEYAIRVEANDDMAA